MLNIVSKVTNTLRTPQTCLRFYNRSISTGFCRKGFEEFFPPGVYEGENYVEENPVVGRRWKISELRIRSNTDLHKFWYVLLKEKNMLLTLDQECKRLGIFVPGATRLHKVGQTMNLVERVVKERETAIHLLEKERRYKFDDNEIVDNKTSTDSENPEMEEILKDNRESITSTTR